MIDWAALAAGGAVVVSGLAAFWAKKAADATEASATKVEHGIQFRWATEQAGSTMPQVRAAGIAAITVMLDSDELSLHEMRLFKAVGRVYLREAAAYAQELQAGMGVQEQGEAS